MKFVYALALLIASVTIFGATAQTVGIENELEELDLLISLNQNDYALDGLVSRVRDGLQRILEQVKAKLADNKELFEQFRAKIEEVQEKIRDLVKQGGARLEQAVQQIREKLQAIIKAVFDKLNNQESFYEAEQEQSFVKRIVQRVRELLQRGLDRLKERLSSTYKEVLEQVKDKVAEFQEKLQEVGKDFGIHALDTIHQLREKFVELLHDVKQKIADAVKGNQYAYYGVEELPQLLSTIKKYVLSDEGFQYIREFARRVQSNHPIVNFVKIFINSQKDDYLKIVLADLFKDAAYFYNPPADVTAALTRTREILITPEGVAKIRQFAKDLKSEHAIVNQVVNLLRAVPDDELVRVIDELFTSLIGQNLYLSDDLEDQDLADYYEGESLLEKLGQGLREFAQSALNRLKQRVSEAKKLSKEVAQVLKEKIEVLQKQIIQLGKEAGQKAIGLYQQIRRAIRDVFKQLVGSGAFYESEESVKEPEVPLLRRIINRVRSLAQRALDKIKERLAPHKEFFDKVKTKISEIQAKIAELGKVAGAKAVEVIKSLRQRLRELVQQVKADLVGSISYETEAEKLQHLQERLVAQIEKQLVDIQQQIGQNARLQQQLADYATQKAELAKNPSTTENIRALTFLHVDLILFKREVESSQGY